MKITINGTPKELNDQINLKETISQFSQNCSRIIAEVNGHIIKSHNWEKTIVKDGDTIELVSFVGGG